MNLDQRGTSAPILLFAVAVLALLQLAVHERTVRQVQYRRVLLQKLERHTGAPPTAVQERLLSDTLLMRSAENSTEPQFSLFRVGNVLAQWQLLESLPETCHHWSEVIPTSSTQSARSCITHQTADAVFVGGNLDTTDVVLPAESIVAVRGEARISRLESGCHSLLIAVGAVRIAELILPDLPGCQLVLVSTAASIEIPQEACTEKVIRITAEQPSNGLEHCAGRLDETFRPSTLFPNHIEVGRSR